MSFFAKPPIVVRSNIFSHHYECTRNFQPFFSTHIASHLYMRRPQMNISCGWARFHESFRLCAFCACIHFHIQNTNFTLKAPLALRFLSTLRTVSLVFLSTAATIWFSSSKPFHSARAPVDCKCARQHSMFVYH